MLIQPKDVSDYSVFDMVKNRESDLLAFDIVQAQADVFEFVGHKFDDPKYTPLPNEVKLALIKVTEYYAMINSDEATAKGISSEKIGDYSYTMGSRKQSFSLSTLLANHRKRSGFQFRMRGV